MQAFMRESQTVSMFVSKGTIPCAEGDCNPLRTHSRRTMNPSSIPVEWGLTQFHMFQVGLLVSSPIFAEASKHINAFRLIAVGLGIWTLSTAGCGVAFGFWSLILCRMLVGVGEASFVALASPFIGTSTLLSEALHLSWVPRHQIMHCMHALYGKMQSCNRLLEPRTPAACFCLCGCLFPGLGITLHSYR